MNEKIYLIDGSQRLREMEAQDYDGEELLQTMLADHPDLLAGHQINESRTTPLDARGPRNGRAGHGRRCQSLVAGPSVSSTRMAYPL